MAVAPTPVAFGDPMLTMSFVSRVADGTTDYLAARQPSRSPAARHTAARRPSVSTCKVNMSPTAWPNMLSSGPFSYMTRSPGWVRVLTCLGGGGLSRDRVAHMRPGFVVTRLLELELWLLPQHLLRSVTLC